MQVENLCSITRDIFEIPWYFHLPENIGLAHTISEFGQVVKERERGGGEERERERGRG